MTNNDYGQENPAVFQPGWYPDGQYTFAGEVSLRYWDGRAWGNQSLPADDTGRAPKDDLGQKAFLLSLIGVLIGGADIVALILGIQGRALGRRNSYATPKSNAAIWISAGLLGLRVLFVIAVLFFEVTYPSPSIGSYYSHSVNS